MKYSNCYLELIKIAQNLYPFAEIANAD